MKRLPVRFSPILLAAAGLAASGVGCSALFSTVDRVTLVHEHSTDIRRAITPPGFVVTPEEIREVAPVTKYGWNLYADRDSYYLSSAVQKLSSSTGDNSWMAKENGIRIRGTDRRDLEKLQDLKRRSAGGIRWSPEVIRKALAAGSR